MILAHIGILITFAAELNFQIMIIYFSGTGNSLAISRYLADELDDKVMTLNEAVNYDLTHEKRIGLVYPCYWFNTPNAVKDLLPMLQLPHKAYTFIIIPCGAQAGNAIWWTKKTLADKGIKLNYSQKIRVPDNSAIGFGRNPNDQLWKFKKYASRLKQIANEVKSETRNLHFSWWGPIGALCATPAVQRRTLPMLTPSINTAKCIGCEICIKVCPQGNISNVNGKAQCGKHCTQCLACVHFCPQQAVELNHKPTPQQHQYHHPAVTTKEMLR